jgi:serine/threonine protein kinase
MFCPSCGTWNRKEAARCIRCGEMLPAISDRKDQPPDHELTLLRQITGGRYAVTHRIGEGGMAAVYYAQHVCLERPVVIKVLHPHLSRETEMRERFRREAESAAQLVHPHICGIIDFGTAPGGVYLVMPYYACGTLGDRISGNRTVSADVVALMSAQVASALDYAHRRGIIHRDIKPDNILFDEDDNAAVTDFGIATAHFRSRMTGTGNVMGTPHYMSPEQARGKILDGRSDVYTLGVVMYEALVGFAPFDGADVYSITYKHLHETPIAPAEVDSRAPAELSGIIMKCLAKKPAERFQSGTELANALRATLK